MKNDTGCVKPKEHKIDMRTPWKVIDMTVKEYGTGCSLEDEVSRLDDIPEHENMAALISNALIGGNISLMMNLRVHHSILYVLCLA